jgi:hypothetical protein
VRCDPLLNLLLLYGGKLNGLAHAPRIMGIIHNVYLFVGHNTIALGKAWKRRNRK